MIILLWGEGAFAAAFFGGHVPRGGGERAIGGGLSASRPKVGISGGAHH
jgi:hypothetical protein